jgi:hypothetical protein
MALSCSTPAPSVFRNVEWCTTTDAAGPILRQAASGAILHDARVEIEFDPVHNEYVLGLTARS